MSFQVLEIPQIVSSASHKVKITKKYFCLVNEENILKLRETIKLPQELIDLIMSFFHPHILPITPTASILKPVQFGKKFAPTLQSLGLLKWAHSWLKEYSTSIEDCQRSRTCVNITKIDIGEDLTIFKHSGVAPMRDCYGKTIRWVNFTHYTTNDHLDDIELNSIYQSRFKNGPKITNLRAITLLLSLKIQLLTITEEH